MKKKILFFMPTIERGGIEKNLIILSNFFLKKNFGVEIIFSAISREVNNKINNKIIKIKTPNNFQLPFVPQRLLNSINCFIFLFTNYKWDKNVIILSLQDHPLPIIISKIFKIKCLIRIANHPKGSLFFFNNRLSFFLKFNIKKFFYYFASGIICNSQSSANFLKKIYRKKLIINILNPIVLKKVKIKKRKKIIISVGRLQNQKNFYGLIKAFYFFSKKIPDYKLYIVGSGSEKIKLLKLCKKLKITKKVKFFKFQKPHSLINSSKLFVLNSLWEGLPNILIEVQNFKVPILSTNCLSGPKEILMNGRLGYLTPVDNYMKLSRKMIKIIKNYNNASIKAKLAYKKIHRFDYNVQCNKYLRFINNFF